MNDIHVPVILGTSRKGRLTEAAARFVEQEAANSGLRTEFIDVRDYATLETERNTDEIHERAWDEVAVWADGFIIVTPEYNHSFPGELKILLDKAFMEYNRKVVALCTVSDGNLGGTRVREQLIQVMSALGMTVVNVPIYFTNADKLFDDAGELLPERREEVMARMEKMLKEFHWYVRALKQAREAS